ncbi:MAG: toprim domain-containing protein, partial [Lysobacteraceae bacterium]
ATSSHPYCRAKGMTNPGAEGLRTVPAHLDDEITKHGVIVASNISHSKEIRKDKPDATILIKGDLLVPAYDMDGKLWSVQSINTNFKSFMKSGRKTGLHTMAGHDGAFNTSPLAKNTDLPIVICEGRATGDSLVRALGYPVVVAFDAGNIPRVAEGLRKAYPDRPILIAGDNDHAKAHEKLPNGRARGNQGMTSAIATAAAVRGATVIPQFEPGEKGSDWNDIAKAKGLPAMRKELMAAVERAMERIRDGQHDAQERASPRERAPASRPAASRTVDPERPAARALQSSQPKQVSHER